MMNGPSLFQSFVFVWLWLIPVLLIMASGEQRLPKKIPWVLMTLPLSWIAVLGFFMYSARSRASN